MASPTAEMEKKEYSPSSDSTSKSNSPSSEANFNSAALRGYRDLILKGRKLTRKFTSFVLDHTVNNREASSDYEARDLYTSCHVVPRGGHSYT